MAAGVAGSAVRHVAALAAGRGAGGLSDADLLRAFAADGDQAAFSALVRRHGALVMGVCRRTLRRPEDAEDAFQATFLLLARKAGSIRRRESLAGWLHGVALRMSQNANRAAGRRARHERRAGGPGRRAESPVTEAALRELQALLDEEVGRLPETYRSPFVLCCLEQRPCADVGRALGLREATVWSRVARARQLLRDRLAGRGVTLTAVLAAAAVASPALPAEVTLQLISATTRGAVLVTESGPVPAGVIPPPIAALLRGAERSMPAMRGKVALALVLAVGGAATAIGLWAGLGPAAAQPATPPGRGAPAPADTRAGPGKPVAPPVDGLGDPLPPGAVARLGTVRFRHGSMVTGLRYAADGKTIISGGYDQVLLAWDAASGREVARLGGAEVGSIVDVDASADGRVVAAVDYSGNVVLGDVPAKRLTRPAFQPAGRNTCVALAPDGKVVAVGAPDHTVRLFDLVAGKEARALRGHAGVVRRVAFAPDGSAVAAGGDDGTVWVWDPATGAETLRLEAGEPVRSVAFSPDGKVLAAGGGAEDRGGSADRLFGRLRLWALPSGKLLHALGSHYPYVAAVAFAPDSRTVAAAAWGGRVELWDVAAGKHIRQVRAYAQAVAFTPDGGTLATGGNDRTVRLWDPATGKERDPGRPGHTGGVRAVAASRDGAVVATAGGDALVRLWDPAAGRERRAIDASSTWFLGGGAMALSPDGSKLVTDKGVWDTATGRFLSPGNGRRTAFRGQDYSIEAIAFAPDGKTVAMATSRPEAAGRDRTVRLWDVATAGEVGGFGTEPVHALAYAPDGKALAAGVRDGSVVLWDPATGKEIRRMRGHKREVNAVAVSPDGRLVASTDYEGGIVLWDAGTGREVRRLQAGPPGNGALAGVRAVAFSPDGRTLAAGGRPAGPDGTGPCAVLWEVLTGRERLRVAGHRGDITSIAFAGTSWTLVTGSDDTTALVWDLWAPPAGARADSPLADGEADRLWAALGDDDAKAAHDALGRLSRSPAAGLRRAKESVRTVPAGDEARLADLIRALDSPRFADRERASRELETVGPAAAGAARKELAGRPTTEARDRLQRLVDALDAPTPDRRRKMRAVELLERVGTPAALDLLGEWAAGAEHATLTEAAKAALRRLDRPPGVRP